MTTGRINQVTTVGFQSESSARSSSSLDYFAHAHALESKLHQGVSQGA